ncbi:MAG: dienelactone hydrolase family protein [Bacteroidota bacterium]
MRIAAAFLFLILFATIACAAVTGREVQYEAEGISLKGYLAYDDAKEKRPGILVVHEWWGHNKYARHRAEMLAGLGYVALAVDMYGEGKTAETPDAAGTMAGAVMKNPSTMKTRFLAALDFLKQQENVDPAKLGAMGYCFGGGVVLAMARQGVDLQGVVSFHGSLASTASGTPEKIKARILVCNGADDKFVSADDIKKFKADMKTAKADMTFINYPGSLHAFTNPEATENGKKFNMAIAYNEKADKKSWSDMQAFFKRVFGK